MKIATCENCGKEIYYQDREWIHTATKNRICSYDYAIPKKGTEKEKEED